MNVIEAVSREKRFVARLIAGYTGCNFRISFCDGSTVDANPGQAIAFTLHLKQPGALRRLFFPPSELAVCESYFFDYIDITGDIAALLNNVEKLSIRHWKISDYLTFIADVLRLPKVKNKTGQGSDPVEIAGSKHSLERDKAAVQFHYDVSNDFYALWLDRNMVYSGAYFVTAQDSLDAAQKQKLDLICRKLMLKQDEEFLDIGCGWGALLFYAVQNFGVKATGVTLSKNQAEYIGAKAKSLGISDRVAVEVKDYRELDREKQFDKIASVEMLIHVGKKQVPEYFTLLRDLLKDGGLSFHLLITNNPSKGKYRSPAFAEKYFLPDYQLLPATEYAAIAEARKWEIVTLENLRQHYMLTAKHWLSRLEANRDTAVAASSEVIFRVWRLSFALMAFGFEHNLIQMHHLLLGKNLPGDKIQPRSA
jgi:cyclopropane-fatty-acyl-phospholipid synthase